MSTYRIIGALLLLIILATKVMCQDHDNAIKLNVNVNGISDYNNYAGFYDQATDNYDSGIDIPDPPVPVVNYIMLSFSAIPSAPSYFTRFREDWRSRAIDLSTVNREWDYTVITDQTEGDIIVSFTIGDTIPDYADVILKIEDNYQDLRQNNTFSYVASGNATKDFTLIVGKVNGTQVGMTSHSDGYQFTSGVIETLSWDITTNYDIQNTSLDVSLDGGNEYTSIVNQNELVTQTTWTVPHQNVDNGILKLSVTDELDREAEAEIDFNILDETGFVTGITWLTPESGEFLIPGENLNITWSYDGGTVNLSGAELSTSINGIDYSPLVTINGSGTSTQWTIPDNGYLSTAAIRLVTNVSAGTPSTRIIDNLEIVADGLTNNSFENWDSYGPDVGPPDCWSVSGTGYGTLYKVERDWYIGIADGGCSACLTTLVPSQFSLIQVLDDDITTGMEYEAKVRILDNTPNASVLLKMGFYTNSGTEIQTFHSQSTIDSPDFNRPVAAGVVPLGADCIKVEVQMTSTAADTIYADYLTINSTYPSVTASIISPTSSTLHNYDGTSTIPIAWDYSPDASWVDSTTLQYSIDDGVNWEWLTSFDDGSTISYSWLGVDTLILDARVKLNVTGLNGSSSEVISDPFIIKPTHREVAVDAGWFMFSLPLETPSSTLNSILGDDVTSAIFAYQYDITTGYSLTNTLSRDSGYWLAIDQTATLDVDGITIVSDYEKALQTGWNIVGNGLPVNVFRSSLKFRHNDITYSYSDAVAAGLIAGDLYKFNQGNGQFTLLGADGYLSPLHGYWLAAMVNSVTMVISVDELTPQINQQILVPDEINQPWEIPISSIYNDEINSQVIVGANLDATDEFDNIFDIPAPPRSPEGHNVDFKMINRSGENLPTGIYLYKDIRGIDSERFDETWSFLATNQSDIGIFRIDFSALIEEFGDIANIELIANEEIIDIIGNPFVEIAYGNQTHFYLRIIDNSVSNDNGNSNLPIEFGIDNIFPNPFNKMTTIQISIPTSGFVNVTIYDLTGRQVCTIHNNFMEAGLNTLNWTTDISSGLYLVRATNSYGMIESRKVVLLK
jgi:Secretion system C-terminal sorting domain